MVWIFRSQDDILLQNPQRLSNGQHGDVMLPAFDDAIPSTRAQFLAPDDQVPRASAGSGRDDLGVARAGSGNDLSSRFDHRLRAVAASRASRDARHRRPVSEPGLSLCAEIGSPCGVWPDERPATASRSGSSRRLAGTADRFGGLMGGLAPVLGCEPNTQTAACCA